MENKIIFILVLFQCIFTNAQTISNDTLAHRYLLFINGHRGPKHDKDIASNNIKIKDSTGYWLKYDDAIIKRFPSSKNIDAEKLCQNYGLLFRLSILLVFEKKSLDNQSKRKR